MTTGRGTKTPRGRRAKPKRRGRPIGASLTPEIERTILAYVEAGAWDYIAAEAAGIEDRTFRDWMARGEGRHPTRSKTPALAAFAKHVREAKARSRAAREIEVAAADPKFWLGRLGRSKPGREGWTEPVPDETDAPTALSYVPSPAEAAETIRMLIQAGVIEPPHCPDPECTCALHGVTDDG